LSKLVCKDSCSTTCWQTLKTHAVKENKTLVGSLKAITWAIESQPHWPKGALSSSTDEMLCVLWLLCSQFDKLKGWLLKFQIIFLSVWLGEV
jgi:hypothetical protein